MHYITRIIVAIVARTDNISRKTFIRQIVTIQKKKSYQPITINDVCAQCGSIVLLFGQRLSCLCVPFRFEITGESMRASASVKDGIYRLHCCFVWIELKKNSTAQCFHTVQKWKCSYWPINNNNNNNKRRGWHIDVLIIEKLLARALTYRQRPLNRDIWKETAALV